MGEEISVAGKWGQGRIEVASLREEIEARLSEGCTVRQLYLSLRRAGQLTISLSTFSARVTHIADELSPLRRSYDAPEPERHAPGRQSGPRDTGREGAKKVADKSLTQMSRFVYDPTQPVVFTEG